MGDVFDLPLDFAPSSGLTVAKLRAARDVFLRNPKRIDEGCAYAYMDRATWIRFGGRPEDFDALPSVDFGDRNG